MNNSINKFLDFLSRKIEETSMNMYYTAKNDLKKGESTAGVLNYNNKNLTNILADKIYNNDEYISLEIKKVNYELLYDFCKNSLDGNINEDYYHNFRNFFETLNEGNFSIREKLDIIKFIMINNIKESYEDIIEDTKYYKFYKLDNVKLKYFNIDDVFDIVEKMENNEKYLEIYLKQIDNIEKRDELILIIGIIQEKMSVNLQLQKQFIDAYELGLDKEENVNNLLDALRKLDVKEEDINPIEEYLNKKFKKEKTKEFSFKNATESYIENEEKKEELRKKLYTYLDSKNLLPIRYLLFSELEEVIIILKKLGIYSDELLRDITTSNENKLAKLSIKEKYEFYLKLIKNYAEEYGFLSELQELNECYNELINPNVKDPKFYSDFMSENLRLILNYIPNTCEYLKETL